MKCHAEFEVVERKSKKNPHQSHFIRQLPPEEAGFCPDLSEPLVKTIVTSPALFIHIQ
ncbi:MAG: hypothetical protein WC877_07945 [Dehalococcoidales bacterium]|jgi:hypothetical protein